MAEKRKQWEIELDNYIILKMKKLLGDDFEFEIGAVHTLFDINNVHSDEYDIHDLTQHYAFTMMSENFEHSAMLKKELERREYDVSITYPTDKTAKLNVFHKTNKNEIISSVDFNIHSEGLIIDFEKAEF